MIEEKMKVFVVSDGYQVIGVATTPDIYLQHVNFLVNNGTEKTVFNFQVWFMTKSELDTYIINAKVKQEKKDKEMIKYNQAKAISQEINSNPIPRKVERKFTLVKY